MKKYKFIPINTFLRNVVMKWKCDTNSQISFDNNLINLIEIGYITKSKIETAIKENKFMIRKTIFDKVLKFVELYRNQIVTIRIRELADELQINFKLKMIDMSNDIALNEFVIETEERQKNEN